MKKGDLIIIIVVFIAAITLGNFVSKGKQDETKNVIVIKDGKEMNNCQDELCVKSHKISRDGEMIVCLPHKLYVKIEDDSDGIDSEQHVDVIAS